MVDRLARGSAAFFLVLALVTPLHAADPPDSEPASGDAVSADGVPAEVIVYDVGRLGDVVVTASRLPGPRFDEPYVVDTVDADRIRDRSYRTSVDLFEDIPAVMVQKTGYGQGSPYIRGFTAYHNLYLIDGVRLNNSAFRSGPNQYWNTVDAQCIDRMEIVKGPGSVLYGTDAIGGTVNVLTKGPKGYGEGFRSGGRLAYRLSSAERSQVGRVEAWGTWDHTFGLYVGGSIKEFGDLEGGDHVGTQDGTAYDEWDADLKAEYFLGPNRKLVFAHQHVQQFDAPRTHKTVDAITWEGLAQGGELARDLDQRRDLTYLQYHAEDLGGAVDAFHAGISWHQQNETRHRARTGGRYDTQGFEVGTLGAFAQAESRTAIGRLAYGIDTYHDNVNSFSSRNAIQGPVGDDADYDLLGLYLRDTIPVHEAVDVILGVRYEYANARARSVEDPNTGNQILSLIHI